MLRPRSSLPALAATAAVLAGVLVGGAGAGAGPAAAAPGTPRGHADERPAPVSRSAGRNAPPVVRNDDPLWVSIDTLSPSYVPRAGPIRISGTLTNHSEDRWLAINVHAFISSSPITTTRDLARETERPADDPVGDRVLSAGTFDRVDALAPGESAQFNMRVRRSALEIDGTGGVYWFGVHALGEGPVARDSVADGRARTFLPLVPQGTDRSVKAALVIPIRHDVRHADDGSIADVSRWARDLESGPLRTLVDFGASAGSRPLTWLVDPAVPEAVRKLTNGNPARSLDDTVSGGPGTGQSDGADSTDSPSAEPASPGPGQEPTGAGEAEGPDPEEVPSNAATEPGLAWLNRVREAVSGNQVLALPYGDLDVSAALEQEPALYREARRRSGRELAPWGLPTDPAVGSPSGYLDPDTIPELRRGETVLLTDRMFGDRPPSSARVSGHRALVTSSAAAGGPGPDDPLSAVALRQQILAEAALRVLSEGRRPLVVVFPQDWTPSRTTGFFEGLDLPWLELTDIDGLDAPRGEEVPADRLTYPETQSRQALGAANFASADLLVAAGETLQNVLLRNDRVAADVQDEALTSLSYATRRHRDASRAATDRSRRWIFDRLSSVGVEAPSAVTLSSKSGRFSATLTNDLDHAVRVRVRAVTDEPMRIEGPDLIEIAANSRASVLLNASTDQLGVSNVQLVVTDEDGTPLGATDTLPIRSAQVSQVIWLILGTGVALLFGAIGVRLVRRIRAARSA